MVSLRKKNDMPSSRIIGEVPVTCRGEVVAAAKVEKLRSGAEVFCIDLSEKSSDILLTGFSLSLGNLRIFMEGDEV